MKKGLALLGIALAAAVTYAGPPPAEEWKAPAEAKDKKSPLGDDAAALDAGMKLYDTKCKTCHGPTGKGDGKAATYLPVKPQDLTGKDAQADSDGELFWKITTGRKPMPGFEAKMTETERWQVIAYVRELAKSSVPAKDEPAKEGGKTGDAGGK